MKNFFRLLLSVAVLLLLAACASSPESRIARNRYAFDSYTPEVQELIRKGHIAVGMNRPQIEMALGSPIDIGTPVRSNYGYSYSCIYKIKLQDPETQKHVQRQVSVQFHNEQAIRIKILP